MIAYASRTGTKRNLDALRKAGWRLMVSAKGVLRTEGFPYALDNGAWTAYRSGLPFDAEAFEKALGLLGDDADFVVAPDIVGGGVESLGLTKTWLDRLSAYRLVLIPVQDGMTGCMVAPFVSDSIGLFVGGTTEWKLATIPMWARIAHDMGCYIHVGRVNSQRRVRVCQSCGVHSFDGSGPSKFAQHLEVMERGLDQQNLILLEDESVWRS